MKFQLTPESHPELYARQDPIVVDLFSATSYYYQMLCGVTWMQMLMNRIHSLEAAGVTETVEYCHLRCLQYEVAKLADLMLNGHKLPESEVERFWTLTPGVDDLRSFIAETNKFFENREWDEVRGRFMAYANEHRKRRSK